MKTKLVLSLSAFLLSAAFGSMVVTKAPKNFQLYPRGSNDSATVEIAGYVTGSSDDSVQVSTYKNGVLSSTTTTLLSFSDDTAHFAHQFAIHAELSEYRFIVRLDTTTVLIADSVVCGDAFLIDGQSNAVTQHMDTKRPSSQWVRSFGKFLNKAKADSVWYADTSWGVAHDVWNSTNIPAGAIYIGTVALTIAMNIADSCSIPVCFLNGAVGGSSLGSHAPKATNIYDSTTYFGRLLRQADRCGIRTGVKGIFWWQGEFESSLINETNTWVTPEKHYITPFTTMYTAWKDYYPALQHVYVFQTRGGKGGARYREAHRRLQEIFPDLTTISTTCLMAYDSPHYFNDGYLQAASWAFPQVRRDLYNYTDTISGLRSPNIKKAYFSNSLRDEITLEFDEVALWPTADTVVSGVTFSMKQNIFLDTISYTGADSSHPFLCVDSGYSVPEEKKIVLHLTQSIPSVASPKYVSLSHQYTGSLPGVSEPVEWISPYIKNPKGLAALTFWRFPVLDSLGTTYNEVAVPKQKESLSLRVFPNPFQNAAVFSYYVNEEENNGNVFMEIVNIKGEVVWNNNLKQTNTGKHSINWIGCDNFGRKLARGVYLVSLKTPCKKSVTKIILSE
jgi:hypothetical protein